jgi:hypothetical protein
VTSTTTASRSVAERSPWRAVALPSEHGGWGLTLEPVLLGLLVAWSFGGLALGVAALGAFLVRTPLKLVVVDARRDRWLARSSLALRIAVAELVVVVAAVGVAAWRSGWSWIVPVLIALPFIAVELWFDVRSRGRRLVPELCGAVGIAAVAASIAIAGGASGRLALGLWSVLAARAVGAIPFVRVQIFRLRRGQAAVWHSDLAQVAAIAIAAVAVLLDDRLVAGAAGIVAMTIVHTVWVRRPPIPAKRLGMRQMMVGFAVVAITAAGVLL